MQNQNLLFIEMSINSMLSLIVNIVIQYSLLINPMKLFRGQTTVGQGHRS